MRIAVCNLKGGVGKTTTSVHLAALLAAEGRTLLVDADTQASALAWSEQAAASGAGLGALGPDGAGGGVVTIGLPVADLHRRLRELGRDYAHIVIDTPPSVIAVARSAMLAADVVVVPMAPSLIEVDRLAPTVTLLAETEPADGIRPWAVLLTRVRAGTRSAAEARQALAAMGAATLDAQLPMRELFTLAFGSDIDPAAADLYRPVLAELHTLAGDQAAA